MPSRASPVWRRRFPREDRYPDPTDPPHWSVGEGLARYGSNLLGPPRARCSGELTRRPHRDLESVAFGFIKSSGKNRYCQLTPLRSSDSISARWMHRTRSFEGSGTSTERIRDHDFPVLAEYLVPGGTMSALDVVGLRRVIRFFPWRWAPGYLRDNRAGAESYREIRRASIPAVVQIAERRLRPEDMPHPAQRPGASSTCWRSPPSWRIVKKPREADPRGCLGRSAHWVANSCVA